MKRKPKAEVNAGPVWSLDAACRNEANTNRRKAKTEKLPKLSGNPIHKLETKTALKEM